MVNKCVIVGRVGKDAAVRFLQNGTAQASFSVATSETWKNKDGGKEEKTEWFNVVAWGKLGEICGEYVKKGMLLYVEGKIATRKWTGKDGAEHSITELIAREMKMLGGGQPKQEKPQETQGQVGGVGPEEDVPF